MTLVSFNKCYWRSLMLAVALLTASLAAAPSFAADDKKDKGAEQVRRLQQKLRTLEQEKSQLAQGKAELDAQLKDGTDKLNQTKRTAEAAARQRTALARDLKQAEDDKAAALVKLEQSEKDLAETTLVMTQALASLRKADVAKMQLQGELLQSKNALADSVAKNESLHRMGATLLNQIADNSNRGLRVDMLTQLKRVGAENMVEEYRDKLDAELVRQQQEDRQQIERKKRAQAAELALKAAREVAQREQEEVELREKRKASQQKTLDQLVKNVRNVFGDVEW